MREDILNNSVVIIGPAGVGKGFISSTISKKTGLFRIPTDIYRYLPHLEELYDKLKNCKDKKEENNILYEIKLREKFPNLPNYKDMGFDANVSAYLKKEYGRVAWHFYHKAFETELLKQIIKQLEEPCILDIGAGTAISIDEEYKKLVSNISSEEKMQYEKLFKMKHNVGFDKIQKLLYNFKNIVHLVLPENYKEVSRRSSKNGLNDIFIKSGQFEKLATFSINTTGLIDTNKDYNPNMPFSDNNSMDKGNVLVAEEIADKIILECKLKKDVVV